MKKLALLIGLLPMAICGLFWFCLDKIFNPITLIFGTIGVFLLYFFVINIISLYLSRNNKVVNGTCISSEFQRIINSKGVIEAEFYNNSFEYFDNYEKKLVIIKSENAITKGSVHKLNIGKNEISFQSDINEAKSTKNNRGFIFWIAGCFGLAVVSEFIGRFLVKNLPADFDLVVIFLFVMGIIFSLFGFSIFRNGVRSNKIIKSAKPIKARVVGYIEHCSSDSDGDVSYSYAPKYEYEYNGKTKTYTSNCSGSMQYEIGEEVTLYMYDNKILEKRGIKNSTIMGLIFFIAGILCLAYVLYYIWSLL